MLPQTVEAVFLYSICAVADVKISVENGSLAWWAGSGWWRFPCRSAADLPQIRRAAHHHRLTIWVVRSDLNYNSNIISGVDAGAVAPGCLLVPVINLIILS
jgi:hypothetical protein